MQKYRWEGSVTLCRTSIEIDFEDASAHSALSQFLLNYEQVQCQKACYTNDTVELLHEAQAEATQVLSFLSVAELKAQTSEMPRGPNLRSCVAGRSR